VNKVSILKEWSPEKLGASRALVHTLRYKYLMGVGTDLSPLLSRPAEEVFKTWDVISASLVDLGRMQGASADSDAETMAFGELALVLDVPIQNILGTHAYDVSFPNHIGTQPGRNGSTQVTNSYALVDAIYSGVTKSPGKKVAGGFNQLCTPMELLGRTARVMSNHNEVLLVGRPHINIYQGLGVTSPIKVREVWVLSKTQDLNRKAFLVSKAQQIMAINKIAGSPKIIL